MTADYQVLFPQEVIRLNAIKRVFSSDVPALEIFGQDFSAVDEVLINDQASPFVEIHSRTRLSAQVPPSVRLQDISSVNVVSKRLASIETSILRFQISKSPAKCSGIMKLMQLYVKLLLTTPGSDIFDPQLGGGVLGMLDASFSGQAGQGLINQFTVASGNVVRQIIAIQGRQPYLPPNEKLLSANIVSAKFSTAQGALLVTVELLSQAGRSALANLVV